MTESMSEEPSMPHAAQGSPANGRRMLLVAGAVAVAALLALVAVAVLALNREEQTEVGECVNESMVVACTQPHEARIVQVVDDVNGCSPPATHAIKEDTGRYLCLVEEPS